VSERHARARAMHRLCKHVLAMQPTTHKRHAMEHTPARRDEGKSRQDWMEEEETDWNSDLGSRSHVGHGGGGALEGERGEGTLY
jgi:hypothetical protein